jgi:hypothetical protein
MKSKALTLVVLTASLAWAQSSWHSSNPGDSNTVPERQTLTLRGFYLSSSIVRPNVTLVCQHGRLISSSFNTFIGTRVGAQARTSPDTMAVAIRIGERKREFKDWKVDSGFRSLRPDPGFVRQLIRADRVDVEFSTPSSARMTAEFMPSPADAPRIKKACGIR